MTDYPRHALDIGAVFCHGDTFVVRSWPHVKLCGEDALCSSLSCYLLHAVQWPPITACLQLALDLVCSRLFTQGASLEA